ncbi:MAG: DUF559 domain-containing protein [Patescibacteria group bacterium]
MFTGIIEAMAEVKSRTKTQLTVERPLFFNDIKVGSSIAVSGVCLSIMNFDQDLMTFDVIPETFKCTKLGSLKVGDKVNLERAMKASDRFEGHVVQGHVESVGCVVSVYPSPSPNPSPTGGGDLYLDEGGDVWKECLYNKEPVNEVVLKYARKMRQNPTDAEAVLWEVLRRNQLEGFTFRRQHPVGTKILDFYCHKAKLGIEVDGEIHKRKDVKECDREKELILGDREIKLMRFTNDEVLHHLPWVLEQIELSIQDPPLPACPSVAHRRRWVGEGMGEREYKGLGVDVKTKQNKTNSVLTITVPNSLLKFITPKGSISLDGVSLTVASVEGNRVTVALIPHTLQNTTLGLLKDDDTVNIETDVMVRSLKQLTHSA